MIHNRMASVVSLALLIGATSAVPAYGQRGVASSFEVGQPFPAITLPALEDGRPASLADFRGKKLLLHVFASW